MAEPVRPVPPEVTGHPLARAKLLAEKLATTLIDEDVSDATLAIAFLTGGVVNHHARDAAEAHELLDKIRQLEDLLLERTMEAAPRRLQ
ncbi:hypothetical protein [Bradyrhizobium arachidis]|uniref:hypothetical protein n=1 Tax=Bradyrhizobium arachidis TaxID=858423 RepID=UPI002163D709|nr:hypothetical protein [Bradyrhizobium arachidis]UVO30230.1 hypothetical protein KUF59_05575 [Bradyrhizobium arachidis]